MIKKCLLLFLLLFAVGSVSAAPTNLTQSDFDLGTVVINSSGTYYLTEDVTITGLNGINITADNVVIEGNGFWLNGTSTSSKYSIYASNRQNITIQNINLGIWDRGIYYGNTVDSKILNTTANAYYEPISISNSQNIEISNCTLNAYGGGINVYYSQNIEISNCNVTVTFRAYEFYESRYNTMDNCIASAQYDAVYLNGNSSSNEITNCTATAGYNAFYIVTYSDGNVLTNCTAITTYRNINPGYDGGYSYYIYDCANNIVDGCTAVSEYEYGIYLKYASNNTIKDCNSTTNNERSIYLLSSSNNTIEGSNATAQSDYGIYLESSSNNIIQDCTATAYSDYGIYLKYASNNSIIGCTAYADTYSAIEPIDSNYNSIINCTAIAGDDYAIRFTRSSYNTLENCVFNTTSESMEIDVDSNYNNITNCTVIAENTLAVSIYASDLNNIINSTLYASNRTVYISNGFNNTITASDIVSNDAAIFLRDGCEENRFYLNIIDGSINNGTDNYFVSSDEIKYYYDGKLYRSVLGNYWAGYLEADTNGDGIIDTPYTVNNVNDTKPLAGIWGVDLTSTAPDDGKIHLTQDDFSDGIYPMIESGYYVLDENITSLNGIMLDSGNVTIDGNGFYMINSGIVTFMGLYDDITIKNIGLTYCGNAINLYNTCNVTVSNCTFLENECGIQAETLCNGTVMGCSFESGGVGIDFGDNVENTTIKYNEFVGNEWGMGIFGKNNWIYLNNFENNSNGNIYYASVFKNYFHSPVVNYEYNGQVYEGRLGNYYDGEEFGASNAGIFNKPYGIEGMIPR